MFETELDFTSSVAFEYDGAQSRQFDTLGESDFGLGPMNVGHRFSLIGLTPGNDYNLQLKWNEGAENTLILSSSGVTVETRQSIPSGVRFVFRARATTAQIFLGAASKSFFKMTGLKWYQQ